MNNVQAQVPDEIGGYEEEEEEEEEEDVETIGVEGTLYPTSPGGVGYGGGWVGGGSVGNGGSGGGGNGNQSDGNESESTEEDGEEEDGQEDDEPQNRAQCIAQSEYSRDVCRAGPLNAHYEGVSECHAFDYSGSAGVSGGVAVLIDVEGQATVIGRQYDSCIVTQNSFRDALLNSCDIMHRRRVVYCPAQ